MADGVYYAQERLYVGTRKVFVDGIGEVEEPVWREIGEEVPEAQWWTDVIAYVRIGKIALVPTSVVQLQARVDQLEAGYAEVVARLDAMKPKTTVKRGTESV